MSGCKWLVVQLGLIWIAFAHLNGGCADYTADWDSLDSRPLPQWYDDAKIGIFLHLGVFSVPSYLSEWFWCYWKCPDRIDPRAVQFMANNYPPGFTYQDFARDFTMEFFNATAWVELFEKSGARYVVLTSKHHEGYTLWPSKYSFSWNSVDVGPKQDVVDGLRKAVRKTNRLRFGLYHSLFEWFNPIYLADRDSNFSSNTFAMTKAMPELYELVNQYQPDLIWSDGDAGPVDYWNSTGFLAWLYNESPVRDRVVVNDRWGFGTSCRHGGYLNCEDRFNPDTKQQRKWENAMTLDKQSWGYRRNANLDDYLSITEVLMALAQTVSNGGNLLLNVGPTSQGTIVPIMQERLLQLGHWLQINGEAIYSTKPWMVRNDSTCPDLYFTASRDGIVTYGIFFRWPGDQRLVMNEPEPTLFTKISLLGCQERLSWRRKHGYLIVNLPEAANDRCQNQFDQQPAWTLRMTNLAERATSLT